MKTSTLLAAGIVSTLVHCQCPTPPGPSDAATDAPAASRLRVTNACAYDVWVAQAGMSGPGVRRLAAGGSLAFDVPAEGLASTRYWVKKGCSDAGEGCAIGQSSAPCGPGGCAPPVDSKVEVTWGCTLADRSQCGFTPQGVRMIDTFWNASAVDGYTFPFSVVVRGGDGRKSCAAVDCSGLGLAACPRSENLSNGGKNPGYAAQDLRVAAGDGGAAAGCFSPCMKLNYPGWGGDGLNAPAGAIEQMYCCPTPPVSPGACQGGPVPATSYVGLVHTACKFTTYGYAYDDGLGARVCSGDAELEVTFGPGCP